MPAPIHLIRSLALSVGFWIIVVAMVAAICIDAARHCASRAWHSVRSFIGHWFLVLGHSRAPRVSGLPFEPLKRLMRRPKK